MQQTEKYQLNLIDPADELSPEPLNANARKVEETFATWSFAPELARLELRKSATEASMDVSALDLTPYQYLLLDLFCTGETPGSAEARLLVNGKKSGYSGATPNSSTTAYDLGTYSVTPTSYNDPWTRLILPVQGRADMQTTVWRENGTSEYRIPSVHISELTSFDIEAKKDSFPAGTTVVLRGIR